jgi:ribosomal protein L11 methyltransferase
MKQYLKISIPCSAELHEILIAELSQLKFESFQELEEQFDAFVQENLYDEKSLFEIMKKYGISNEIVVEKQKNINWNKEWEKNFDPAHIDGKVQIRATFHEPQPEYIHDVIINPKMAFGTGHHETTQLVVTEQLTIKHENKSILDVGTGTGVLAIMANKLGAKSITATDVDDWCIDNSRDNLELNKVENCRVLQGTIDKLTLPGSYNIIYANINKNVLMSEIPYYRSLLDDQGILVLSGFYSEDVDELKEMAFQNGLSFMHTKTLNNWALIHFLS